MILQTPAIDVHSSVDEAALRQEAVTSLRNNRIEPKFLYVTSHQSGLWRQIFLRHSPIHGNPEFSRIYREAFGAVLGRISPEKVLLVGLGCGTGAKELDLYRALHGRGRDAVFAAIDVSRDLVAESIGQLTAAGAEHRRSLVCDLTQTDFLKDWLEAQESTLPRLITFFGLVPNFMPSAIAIIFRAILRPGDLLLVSAHLAPVRQETPDEIAAGMSEVLPQYNNHETLAWLSAALENWGLTERVQLPGMIIGEVEGVPAFLGLAHWKTTAPFEQWGQIFTPSANTPLRLFYSLRYTPQLFEEKLRQEGLHAERLAITSCRQEAIWCIRSD